MKLQNLNLHLLTIFHVLFLNLSANFPENTIKKTDKELINNKNIVMIGGTGYLGSMLSLEILKYQPNQLIIFSRDEVKHFNLYRILGNRKNVKYVVGDIRDYQSVLKVTRSADIVFHAAALKRMDLLESNVEEAIKTNVIGSVNVFNACVENNVKEVVFISTDKACLSINAYGASKFLSEKLFTNYDRSVIKTIFKVVRFGNILESTGSVIPIFNEKIKNGSVIPLTHSEMTRFVVDKKDAVELIFTALKVGIGGEIFIRKLPAMKIIDLINVISKMYNACPQVVEIGMRPGEKIHEVLINKSEMSRAFEFDDYYIIAPSIKTEDYSFYDTIAHKKNYGLEDYSSDGEVIDINSLDDKLRLNKTLVLS